MGFPKWKYHASRGEQVINSEEQEKELGAEWKESPADFGVIRYPANGEKAESYREWCERWQSKAEKAEAKEQASETPKAKSKKQKAE